VSEIVKVAQQPMAGSCQQGSEFAGSLHGSEFVQLVGQLLKSILLKCSTSLGASNPYISAKNTEVHRLRPSTSFFSESGRWVRRTWLVDDEDKSLEFS
jgi:hypothetical protein